MVARRSGSDPLGTSRRARPQEHVRDHDLGARSARAAAAAGARRAHHAARRRPRAQRRLDAATKRWSRRFPAPTPPPATSSSAAISITRSRAPTTTRAGAPANLEIARTLRRLIDAKRIPPPARTIRFIWPSEMTGTIAYLAKYPEIAARIRAAVHLDMVGGDPFITKSVLHVTRSPWSIATVTDDVAGGVRALRDRRRDARGRRRRHGASHPLAAADRRTRSGPTSRPTRAAAITGSIRRAASRSRRSTCAIIPTSTSTPPAIVPDNIEPTKIKRSAFIAAASGYYLATMPDHGAALLRLSYANAHERLAEDGRRAVAMAADRAHGARAANIVTQGAAARAAAAAVAVALRGPRRGHLHSARKRRAPDARPGRDAAKGCCCRPCRPAGRSARARRFGTDTRPACAIPRQGSAGAGRRLGPREGRRGGRRRCDRTRAEQRRRHLRDRRTSSTASRTVGEIRDAVSAEFEPLDWRRSPSTSICWQRPARSRSDAEPPARHRPGQLRC